MAQNGLSKGKIIKSLEAGRRWLMEMENVDDHGVENASDE